MPTESHLDNGASQDRAVPIVESTKLASHPDRALVYPNHPEEQQEHKRSRSLSVSALDQRHARPFDLLEWLVLGCLVGCAGLDGKTRPRLVKNNK